MATLEAIRSLPDGWYGPGTKAFNEAALDTLSFVTFLPRATGEIYVVLHGTLLAVIDREGVVVSASSCTI